MQNCSFWGTWGDNFTSYCVHNCPANSFADNDTDLCVANCPPGTFADNSTWRCVVSCPQNPALYGDINSSICVINCPNNFYGDDLTRTCVPTCPLTPRYYAYNLMRRCYQDCLYPYFGEYDIGMCVLACYYGEYGNMTTHKCTRCPIRCTSCISELGCQTCVYDLNNQNNQYFLFNGTCLPGCSPLYTNSCISECPYNYLTNLITYASPISKSCVETCPLNYYGLNSTLRCIQTCPSTTSPATSRAGVSYVPTAATTAPTPPIASPATQATCIPTIYVSGSAHLPCPSTTVPPAWPHVSTAPSSCPTK